MQLFGNACSMASDTHRPKVTDTRMTAPPGDARPLSPHATIYRWPLNAIMSILHRITGVGLAVGAVLVVWWFTALSVSPGYYRLVDTLLTSILGDLVMFGLLGILWYHFCNGLRHLVWDTGAGLDEVSVRRSALAGWAGTLGLTAASLLVFLYVC